MSALPELIFVTYYRIAPIGQMGVFKRCTRLIEQLLGDYTIHLVNIGPLPERDAQFAAIRDRITVHALRSDDVASALLQIFGGVRARAIVFGEAPVRGHVRLAHRVATKLRLRQLAIENTFDRRFAAYVAREYPDIDRWLLMGPLENGFPERLSEKVLAVPTFLRYPENFGALERDRVTVVGYDLRSLAMGIRLLQFLEPDEPVDFLVTAEGRAMLDGIERPNMRVLELPDDAAIYESMARAKYVIGKAGYGQITESLMLGAPIVARLAGGAMRTEWLASFIKPHVRILPSEHDLSGVPSLPPPTRFAGVPALIPDPVAFAARALRSLLDDTPLELPGKNEICVEETVQELFGLSELKRRLEERRWSELQARTIWLFDRAADSTEFAALLDTVFAGAADVRLLFLAHPKVETRDGLAHVTANAVLLWGERETWNEHELELDLHVGWRPGENGEVTFEYIGATQPVP